MNPIAIFKPGKHPTSNGDVLEFSNNDVAATVAAYDKEKHKAPLVIGHPKTDTPAYGWVDSLGFADGLLQAHPNAVTPEFADWVNAGHYKKVSASFYLPNHPNNPVQGGYYLKHVGFLGGTPPAVKGLPEPSFSEQSDLLLVEFSEVITDLLNDSEQTALKARSYHAEQHSQGNFISFSEAVDSVHAMDAGELKPEQTAIRARAYRTEQHSQGNFVSFAEAVDTVHAMDTGKLNSEQTALKARSYHAEQHSQGNFISFSEAVDSVSDFTSHRKRDFYTFTLANKF